MKKELKGDCRAYWKAAAEKEIRKMEERQINGGIFFGADGVVRWKSNNRVMPNDCREILSHTVYRDLFSEDARQGGRGSRNRSLPRKLQEEYQGTERRREG